MARIGDPLPRWPNEVIRYQDPEEEDPQECIDVGAGTWLRHRKTREVKKVLRVDVHAKAVRWDYGSDEENRALEHRTQWARVISFDTGLPFFDVLSEEEAQEALTKPAVKKAAKGAK